MPQTRHLVVDAPAPRLDRYLAEREAGLSRTFIQRLITRGLVTVNGQATHPSHPVHPGDQIQMIIPDPEPPALRPEAIPLCIIYEDHNVLVIDKEAGMVVHPAPGHAQGTLVNAILAHCRDLSGVGGELRPGIVHRLDKDTSGLLMIAKNDVTHRFLAEQFKQRTTEKVYLALVHGHPHPPRGTIDAPIGRDPLHRQRMAVIMDGRPARTHYRVLEEIGPYALLEAYPETGRTHQVRVHLASVGHPVVGDAVYGPRRGAGSLRRHFLHAARLRIRLPGEEQPRVFMSPLPPELMAFLARARLDASEAGGE